VHWLQLWQAGQAVAAASTLGIDATCKQFQYLCSAKNL
jgi:hypothetical protein